MLPLPCMPACSFLLAQNRTRDRGCSKHPVFPAPSDFDEGKEDANLGQFMSRDRERTFSLIGWAKERSAVPTMHHRDRCEMVGTLALCSPYSPVIVRLVRAIAHWGGPIQYSRNVDD